MNSATDSQAHLNVSNAPASCTKPTSAKEFVDDGRLLSDDELRQLTPEQQIAYACGTQIVASFVPVKPTE